MWWLARGLPVCDSVSPFLKSSFLGFELCPAPKEDPDKQSWRGGRGLAAGLCCQRHKAQSLRGRKWQSCSQAPNQQILDSLCTHTHPHHHIFVFDSSASIQGMIFRELQYLHRGRTIYTSMPWPAQLPSAVVWGSVTFAGSTEHMVPGNHGTQGDQGGAVA